ncbi:unnamed protein product [Caenorhabditis auriculariae]|uniref:Uncharacterized protein n=1 Tax=Caenorhabditis auriculariae TaxID=2777116 RepID=A0A8S1HDT3_9PELO|nr:unnamed protein product [Caenorhabditis auriculariae]
MRPTVFCVLVYCFTILCQVASDQFNCSDGSISTTKCRRGFFGHFRCSSDFTCEINENDHFCCPKQNRDVVPSSLHGCEQCNARQRLQCYRNAAGPACRGCRHCCADILPSM